MKKLKLDLEAVAVESFDVTAGEREEKGTVHGHITIAASCEETACCSPNATCEYTNTYCECATNEYTCRGQATCVFSCFGTCRC